MAALTLGVSWEFTDGIPETAVLPRLGPPRRPVAVGLGHPRDPGVMVYGRLPKPIERELVERGARILAVSTIPEAVRALAYESFVSVAVDPSAESGIALVKAIKLEESPIAGQEELLLRAGWRQRNVPFVILPLPGDDEYAVIVAPPKGAFLERTLPISRALLDLDVRHLQPKRTPRR